MNEFKKESVDQELGGQADQLKGNVKKNAGKLLDREDWEAEGAAEEAGGKVREGVGKAGRNLSDLAERAKDKLKGD